MLSPELIRKIRGIHVRTARLVDTFLAGQYHSAFKGAGIEFEEVREYSPGDEVRSIDWNVTARMGRPYVKLYREERELVIMLMVDLSASGAFGSRQKLKREYAAELGAILAYNAIRNNDRVGAMLFTDRVEKYIPPKKGTSHVWHVIQAVLSHEPESPRTDIGEALRFLGRVMRKRCVAFLISDFVDNGFDTPLAVVSRRHDVIGIRVSDPSDGKLPEGGIVALVDPETGRRMTVDASHRATRKAYASYVERHRRETEERLKRVKTDVIDVVTTESPVEPIRKFFKQRELRKAGVVQR